MSLETERQKEHRESGKDKKVQNYHGSQDWNGCLPILCCPGHGICSVHLYNGKTLKYTQSFWPLRNNSKQHHSALVSMGVKRSRFLFMDKLKLLFYETCPRFLAAQLYSGGNYGVSANNNEDRCMVISKKNVVCMNCSTSTVQ